MALPLILGALPGIFSAIAEVSGLFDSGREAVRALTGRATEASTPEELRDEIEALPEDQQARWAETMQHRIARYRAETERLDLEQGRVDPALTAKLSSAAADRVAVLRQTTRPWAVRMAMHFLLLPVYLAAIDAGQGILGAWLVEPLLHGIGGWPAAHGFRGFSSFGAVFGVAPSDLLGHGDTLAVTVFGRVYTETATWLVPIVISYMGLREVGKWRDARDAPAIPDSRPGTILHQAGTIADQVADMVRRVREVADGMRHR